MCMSCVDALVGVYRDQAEDCSRTLTLDLRPFVTSAPPAQQPAIPPSPARIVAPGSARTGATPSFPTPLLPGSRSGLRAPTPLAARQDSLYPPRSAPPGLPGAPPPPPPAAPTPVRGTPADATPPTPQIKVRDVPSFVGGCVHRAFALRHKRKGLFVCCIMSNLVSPISARVHRDLRANQHLGPDEPPRSTSLSPLRWMREVKKKNDSQVQMKVRKQVPRRVDTSARSDRPEVQLV